MSALRKYSKLAKLKVTKLLRADKTLQKIEKKDDFLYDCFSIYFNKYYTIVLIHHLLSRQKAMWYQQIK